MCRMSPSEQIENFEPFLWIVFDSERKARKLSLKEKVLPSAANELSATSILAMKTTTVKTTAMKTTTVKTTAMKTTTVKTTAMKTTTVKTSAMKTAD